MSNSTRDSAPQRPRSEPPDRVDELRARVQRLRDRVEALEAERDRLRAENRALRDEVTHARLDDGVLASLEEGTRDAEPASETPPAPVDLYRALPSPCTFRTFFRVAENEGVDASDARRYLRQFLNRGHLARDGAQLRKQDPVPEEE